MVVPAVIIAAMAILAAADRREPSSPVHLFLLLLAGAALMALSGFARPRSFLYLAPVLAALLNSSGAICRNRFVGYPRQSPSRLGSGPRLPQAAGRAAA